MRLLITGAAGDFGRDLCPWMAERHEVRSVDLRPVQKGYGFCRADLTDPEQVRGLCDGIDAVIHLAAALPTRPHSMAEYCDANVRAVALLCEEATRAGVGRFVYISTVWATGHGAEEGSQPRNEDSQPRPICVYGLTKYQGEIAAEYFARVEGLSVLVLRAAGYVRNDSFDAEGGLDWATADLPSIATSLCRPGQKLFNPADLGEVMQAAISLPEVGFERLVFGIPWPFDSEDAELLRTDPAAVWEAHYPGARACFEGIGFEPPPMSYYYDTTRAQQRLGLRVAYGLSELISDSRSSESGP